MGALRYRIGMSKEEFLDVCKTKYATSAVVQAVKYDVIKKESCVVCGSLKSVGHHPNYGKLLEVIWLCQSHRVKEHKELGWGRKNVGVSLWLQKIIKGVQQ